MFVVRGCEVYERIREYSVAAHTNRHQQSPVVRRKLTVGSVSDPAEREADRLADVALAASDLSLPFQRQTPIRRRAEIGPEGGDLDQRTENAIVAEAARAQPLAAPLRDSVESAFDADFTGVRIQPSSDVAPRIGASAFTHGHVIHFAAGQYRPDTDTGRHTLAHELAHVVQQGAAPLRRRPVTRSPHTQSGPLPVRVPTSHDQTRIRRLGSAPDGVVQRKLDATLTKDAFLAKLSSDPASRQLKDHRPSTGLGRFDAEYEPDRNVLTVTVRPFFDFVKTIKGGVVAPGGWTKKEQDAFVKDFQKQTESAWSGKFEFTCAKPGFEGLYAYVWIKVLPAVDVNSAHFHCRIQKEKDQGTGIGREQNSDPTAINVGNFAQQDAPVRPHDSKTTCQGMMSHDSGRLARLLKAYEVNPIRFKDGSTNEIGSQSKDRLAQFLRQAKKTERPSSVPIPLVAIGKRNKREKDKDAAARAQSVKSYIDSADTRYKPCETKMFDDVVSDQQTVYENKKIATYKAEEKKKLDELKGRQRHREVELAIKPDFQWNGDPYSILAHEFGHMLGNPDEYFEYGSSAVRDKKVKQLLDTNRPDDKLRADALAAVGVNANDSTGPVQESAATLAEAAGQELQEFGPKTSSIMSAGADVLPVHYAPLWEALGKITQDVIKPSEWKIA